jgi:hypothetical protein
MAAHRVPRNDVRRDQRGPRERREELQDSVRSTDVQPRTEHPNRDQARGDRDRTGRRGDEDTGAQ